MMEFSNRDLIERKKSLLQQSPSHVSDHLSFAFHGVAITLHSPNQDFVRELARYLPQSWHMKGPSDYHIYHQAPLMDLEQWENEESSLLHSQVDDHQTLAIHRDFAARYDFKSKTVHAFFHPKICDGFYNFFRWFLSERLLTQKKMMLHSSAILDQHHRAHIFLGPSGAGKTTVTELSHPRTILGDDMNLLSIEGGGAITCAPGAVGGLYQPQVALDQTFPVAGFYWLVQAKDHQLARVNKTKQFQYLYSSIANISWQGIRAQELDDAWQHSSFILQQFDINVLHFSKDNQFWQLLSSP